MTLPLVGRVLALQFDALFLGDGLSGKIIAWIRGAYCDFSKEGCGCQEAILCARCHC